MSFAETEVALAEAAAQDRAPDGRRLARFRWAWTGGAGWLMPRAPRPAGASLSADFTIVSAGVSAGAGPAFGYRIAHAVRQDLWRALAGVRGFWPVVRVTPAGGYLAVTAGGFLPGPFPGGLADRIGALVTPARQRLWTGWAAATTHITGD